MSYEAIDVKPLNPVIGAEISGVDISKPLGNQLYQEIHDALMEHQVIFFRDQEMTLDEHMDFGKLFGVLHIHPSAKKTQNRPEIGRNAGLSLLALSTDLRWARLISKS